MQSPARLLSLGGKILLPPSPPLHWIDMDKPPCPECKSTDVIKDGFKFTRSRGRVQRYQCKHCGRKFISPKKVVL